MFQKAGVQPLTQQILKQQLVLIGRVAMAPAGDPLRRDTFVDHTLRPQIGRFIGRRGRPRQNWTSEVMREGQHRFGHAAFHNLLSDTSQGASARWRQEVKRVVG